MDVNFFLLFKKILASLSWLTLTLALSLTSMVFSYSFLTSFFDYVMKDSYTETVEAIMHSDFVAPCVRNVTYEAYNVEYSIHKITCSSAEDSTLVRFHPETPSDSSSLSGSKDGMIAAVSFTLSMLFFFIAALTARLFRSSVGETQKRLFWQKAKTAPETVS